MRSSEDRSPEVGQKPATAAERLEVVGELASLINTTFDLDEIFPKAILIIKRVLEFRRASVVLVSHDRSSYYLHTLYDEEGGGLIPKGDALYPLDRGLTGSVIMSGAAIRIDDYGGTQGIRTQGEGRISALIVPLSVNDEVIGTLNLGAAESARYTDEDLELAVLLGRQIETSLHYSNLLATIRQQQEELAEEHAQVRSERSRLEALIDASDSAVLMVSAGRIAHANQAMAELLVLPREVLVGAPLEMVDRVLTRSLKNPGDLAAQVLALHRDGAELRDRVEFSFPRELVCERTVAPVSGADGDIIGHVLMYRDVTREAAAEAAKSEFVSIVSHELRTPLTSIKTSLTLFTKGAAGPLTEKMDGLLGIALRNLERLIRLVDDLLDLSRIESGRMLGTLSPTSLSEAIAGAVEAVRDFASDRKVGISWTSPEDDTNIMADHDRLQQVIVNLLSNAVKFSPQGGVVSLGWEVDDHNVVLAIEDEGPGIPEDQLGAIFDKFRQLERSSTRQHGGAGLGLAISRTIVEEFGGEMWAESTVGEGSVFYARFRLARKASAADVGGQTAGRTHRLLVIDKDVSMRELIVESFEREGWVVVAGASGSEGLERAASWAPDVIAVSIELQDMHGLEFLEQLRSAPATVDTPALLFGGGAEGGQAISYGADGSVDADPHVLLVEARRLAALPRRKVILLVEDDPAIRVGLGRNLRRAGYACLEASSGELGLQLARQRAPDILVTDWRVPGKDGMELLSDIRAEPALAGMPAIVVTGYADTTDVTAIRALDAHLIAKPFSSSAIIKEIDRLIGAQVEKD